MISKLINIIKNRIDIKNKNFSEKHKEFEIIEDITYNWMLEYYDKYNILFIDLIHYPFLFKNNSLYIDVEQYTDVLNYIFRTFILRINHKTFSDPFTEMVYKNEINNPRFILFLNKLFDIKENISNDILDIYKNIIFNDNITYIQKEDVIELFNSLSDHNLMAKTPNKNIFKLATNISLDYFKYVEFNEESNNLIKPNKNMKHKKKLFHIKNFNKLKNLKTKFTPVINNKMFDNYKLYSNTLSGVFLLPQFLLFYNKNSEIETKDTYE